MRKFNLKGFIKEVICPLIIILLITFIILFLSGCGIQEKFIEEKIEKEFEKTITGIAYAPINKKFNNIERIKVKKLQDQLGINEKIIKIDRVREIYINDIPRLIKPFTITYIPVTYEDVCKTKSNGRLIFNKKILENLIYNEEDL